MSDIRTIPLAACKLAPENARQARGDVAGLMASIASESLLDPLHVYLEGKVAMVWDGGRRLKALKALHKARKLPADLAEGVPVLVSEKDAACRQSVVTFVREGLHPAREFKAYKAMLDKGESPERIGAAMGVDTRRVAQILKLANLAPEILDAFEAGDFSLGAAQAFTLTDDHERQRQVLAACQGWVQAPRVRQLLQQGMTSPRERLARFVGREAYEAAGGGFLVDLFTEGEEAEAWTDSGLVERLATEKMAKVVEDLKAEGWGWVEVLEPYDFGWGHGYERVSGSPVELDAEEQAAYDAAAEVLEHEGAGVGELDAAAETLARLEAKMEAGGLTAEEKAEAGVFIQLDAGGLLTIRRGYRKRPEATGEAAGKKAQAAAPHGWGHTGHWHMTHIATAATRHALLKDPAAAYDVLVASLAWEMSHAMPRGGALKLQARGVRVSDIPAEARLAGEADWTSVFAAWRERLPTESFEDCFDFVVGLPAEEKAELLALGVGLGLDAVELRHDQRRSEAWRQLGVFMRRTGVDLAGAWRPDATFLARGTRDALVEALSAEGVTGPQKARKSELVSLLAAKVAVSRWLPGVLARQVAR
ncbi:ParB/RepB/Spo0J family partition protein [Caulobacter sp. KR2-114]|uniref:ParB/RepB/Spo0J family partition protein n=1 Tax=Caulobacter sp. KR2-114 TaxID=3400912 RepID=UPI003BFAFA21